MHEASRVKIPIDESSSSNTTPYDHASSTQSGTSSPAGSSSGDGSASAASAASASSASVASEADPRSREIIELKDSLLRSVADYRNLQERTKREVQSIREFAIQRFATDLLESLDNLDRALSAVPVEKAEAADAGSASPSASPSLQQPAVDPDLVNLYSGLKMTYRVLTQTLNRHGLQAFDPSADGPATTSAAFDPNRHEAIFMAPQPGKENGTVFHTQQKGYTLNGRVVRVSCP